eukprot:5885660-Pyramimonas_sp.AAC.1
MALMRGVAGLSTTLEEAAGCAALRGGLRGASRRAPRRVNSVALAGSAEKVGCAATPGGGFFELRPFRV